MVERMRSGASSTVTGSMRRMRSALVVGAGCGVAVGICIWARAEVGARRREAPARARVRLPSWMKCRRCKGFAPAGLAGANRLMRGCGWQGGAREVVCPILEGDSFEWDGRICVVDCNKWGAGCVYLGPTRTKAGTITTGRRLARCEPDG